MGRLAVLKQALTWADGVRSDLFRSHGLRYLVIIAFIVAFFAGTLLFIIDPKIPSLWDGVWCAWVTMTHVGSGDVVPISFLGRLLTLALMLFGWGVFAFFTALISVALMDQKGQSPRFDPRDPDHLERNEVLILRELIRLHMRLDQLQKHLTDRQSY